MAKQKKWLFSKSRTAEALGIGRPKLDRIIEDGKLNVVMVDGSPMILISELKRFISENTVTLNPSAARHPGKAKKSEYSESYFYCKICKKYNYRDPKKYYAVDVCPACERLKKNRPVIEELKAKKYQAMREARVS